MALLETWLESPKTPDVSFALFSTLGMKFLLAIALVTLAVASAHHDPKHTLRGPRFQPGKVYKYDVEFNVTSGVLGLSSQVSKSAIKAEVAIYAKDFKEYILKIVNVYTSGSVKAVEEKYGDIRMEKNSDLEDRLSLPIKFTLEKGEVTSYTLSPRESLESKKIKKSILRSLEMHVPEKALVNLESESELKIPVTYNTTKNTESGVHTSHYMITVSPYAEFPDDLAVYNITRSDDFEAERYPAYKMHHNFRKQGCPEVCRKDWRSNTYGAGCPVGHEPHHSPIKMSFNHQHHLSFEDEIMNPEIIRTTETHVAQMYDQDMEVLITFQMRRRKISTGSIVDPPSDQQKYTDLADMKVEINEKEIEELCLHKTADDSIASIKKLLTEISKIIVEGKLEGKESAIIGHKVILLKSALIRLNVHQLEKVREFITEPTHLPTSQQEDKVIRQIWLDVLPLIGTEGSVTFITNYIKAGLTDGSLLVWEVKEILEALPQNIHRKSERNIRDIRSLITGSEINEKIRNNHLLHSATHITLARIIGEMCGNVVVIRSQSAQRSSWFQRNQESSEESSSSSYGPVVCTKGIVAEIVKEFTQKLEASEKKENIAVYLETLAHLGVPEVLPVIAKYVYGTAHNLQKYTPSYIDYVKTVSLFAMHNIVGRYPEEVLQIALPAFFNGTENPKVRNAAFSVIIRCQPSLEILQHVAHKSWSETSKEVGSYVTSTLETFGNSTLPCMQLTSHRIKKVLPQLKRFDIGVHHAKNLLWSYFDEQREFGLESRMEYTPSNESVVPSSIYKSLSYSSDSLRDVLMQMALNVQGLTEEMIWNKIEKFLDLRPTSSFDARREKEIFDEATIRSRVPESLRFTIYKRIFYTSSYYYFDTDSNMSLMDNLSQYLKAYLKISNSEFDGHLVKMFLPSTYHTVAIAKTLPYPVEFEMKQPLIFAVKVKSLEKSPTTRKFNFHIRPSVYFTKLYTTQMKNIGDCKEVGVYHEHKFAMSYPFEIKFQGIHFPNVTLKYKVPVLNKKVLTYYSESGTYAGKKQLETLPFLTEKEAIRTLPTPFKIEKKFNIVGLPALNVQVHTEDIDWTNVKHPRNPIEALHIVVRNIMNAGWRYKSLNVTLYEDTKFWPRDTEVTFNLRYHREHIAKYFSQSQSSMRDMSNHEESEWNSEWAPSQWSSESHHESQSEFDSQRDDESEWVRKESHRFPEDSESSSFKNSEGEVDWSRYLKPEDIPRTINPETYIDQGRKCVLKLHTVPHIKHVWKIAVETTPLRTSAYFHVEYNHTYTKDMHAVRAHAGVRPRHDAHTYEVTLDHVMGFLNKPNEFQYNRHPETRRAVFITAVELPGGSVCHPWEKVETIFKGVISYESLQKLIENELLTRVHPKYFLPETHEKCLKDLGNGEALSIDCLKAMREKSIYNKLYMTMLWNERPPKVLQTVARRADIYFKHYWFHHLNLTEERNTVNKITVRLNHIDKFTDEPVFDLKIRKPTETVEFKRVPTRGFQPLNSVYGIVETATMEKTNNTYPATCVMMEKSVRTYDLKTYRFPLDKCNYVLTTHCIKNKIFAITARALDTTKGTKEITIYIVEKTIVLTPKSGSDYKVRFNNREVIISSAILLDSKYEIYAYPEYTSSGVNLRIVGRMVGINVLYDGVNVKIQVDPLYKGELCGLCSEFDGEELREFRGGDQCLYSHPIDFINTHITKREGSCDKTHLFGKRICRNRDDEVENFKEKRGMEEEHEPTFKRNIVQTRNNEFCFSILPVPVCEDNVRPSETEPQLMAFHCLPKRDVTAKKLLTESKRRVLGEIASKSADFEETVEVAKMC